MCCFVPFLRLLPPPLPKCLPAHQNDGISGSGPALFLPCCPRTSSKTDCRSAESLLRSLLSLPPSQPDDRKPRIYIPMTTGLPLLLLWYLGKVCRKRRRKEEGGSGDDCRKIGVEWGREACGYIALPSTEGRKGAVAEVGREGSGSPWSAAAFSVSGGGGQRTEGERNRHACRGRAPACSVRRITGAKVLFSWGREGVPLQGEYKLHAGGSMGVISRGERAHCCATQKPHRSQARKRDDWYYLLFLAPNCKSGVNFFYIIFIFIFYPAFFTIEERTYFSI